MKIMSFTIAEDLRLVLIPHIDWAMEYEHNQQRMSVEIVVEGLANLLGIVAQDVIRKYLKLVTQNDSEEDMVKVFGIIRQYSLLLDSMEWAENPDSAENEDIQFVSRYGWEDKPKMMEFIKQRSQNIDTIREFSLEELAQLRQWGSPTTGHPEFEIARGIENTSGPLGQGHVFAIGAAIAAKFLAAHTGNPTFAKETIYAYISDGGVQEEISQGGARIAAVLGLDNLIMFYDSNDIQLST